MNSHTTTVPPLRHLSPLQTRRTLARSCSPLRPDAVHSISGIGGPASGMTSWCTLCDAIAKHKRARETGIFASTLSQASSSFFGSSSSPFIATRRSFTNFLFIILLRYFAVFARGPSPAHKLRCFNPRQPLGVIAAAEVSAAHAPGLSQSLRND